MIATAPYRSDGMDHEAGGQVESRRDARFTGRATHASAYFRDCAAGFKQARTRGAMDGAVDPAASEQQLIRRVDDRVNAQRRDVGLDNLDGHGKHSNPSPVGRGGRRPSA